MSVNAETKGFVAGIVVGLVLIVALSLTPNFPRPFPPTEPQEPPRPTTADVIAAIGRISMGNTGCTATIVGPVKDEDKKIHMLTAAHCIRVGAKGVMQLKDGRKINFKCVTRDADSDSAWLVADRPEGKVPWALLATKNPEKGAKVFHHGYGVHIPNNKEDGTFQGISDGRNQNVYYLSVSSGDSGGGIVATESGEVLSPVCCTSRLSGPGNVWGATPFACASIKPTQIAHVSEEGRINPIIQLPAPGWPEPGRE